MKKLSWRNQIIRMQELVEEEKKMKEQTVVDRAIDTLVTLFHQSHLKRHEGLRVSIAADCIALYLEGGLEICKDYDGNRQHRQRSSTCLSSQFRSDELLGLIAGCKSREEVLKVLNWSEFTSLLDVSQSNHVLGPRK